MRRNKRTDIIFSNDDFASQSGPKRGKRQKKEQPKEFKRPDTSYEFNYNFKEYLRLLLAKVLPRGESDINFYPEHGCMKGEQQLCRELNGRALNQLQTMKFKTIHFFNDEDIDLIQFWLDAEATIYRPGVIDVALKHLQKKQFFREQCQQLRNHLRMNNIIFMRVTREKEKQALLTISKILREHSGQSKDESRNIQFNQDLLGNSLSKLSKYAQYSTIEGAQEMEDSGIVSVAESSYEINQDDSSLDMHCIYHQKRPMNISYSFDKMDA